MVWFTYNFDDSVVLRVPAYEGENRVDAFTKAEVRVRYWNEHSTKEM